MIFLCNGSPPLQAAVICATVTEIPQTECKALISLYKHTNGAQWTNNSDWNVKNTPCSWYGITCRQGHVTGIYLSFNQLKGLIPKELSYLTRLTSLSLDSNQLYGPIPKEFGKFTQLRELYLYSNQLSGFLPKELGQLTQLRELDLFNNQLSGFIPKELGKLTHLEKLYVGFNQFSGPIPETLGRLTKLRDLDLFNNRLSGPIPKTLSRLTQLQKLYLSFNQLSGAIPKELGNLANLRRLALSSNRLSGKIPDTLGKLVKLQRLSLEGNCLSGEIPTSLSQLSYLTAEETSLGYNALTTSEQKLIDFLEKGEAAGGKDPDWAMTQTIPPTDLNAKALSTTAVKVAWTAIPYTEGAGYYQVKYATRAGGPYTDAETTTTDKQATSYTVSDLSPNTTYYFVVETHSYAQTEHDQLNELTSTHSAEITFTTPSESTYSSH
jgi:hypothetical protein